MTEATVKLAPPISLVKALEDWAKEMDAAGGYMEPSDVSSRLNDIRLDTRTLELPPRLQRILADANSREESRKKADEPHGLSFPVSMLLVDVRQLIAQLA